MTARFVVESRNGFGRFAVWLVVTIFLFAAASTSSQRPSDAQAMEDTAAPVLVVPADVRVVTGQLPPDAVVRFVVTASDLVDGVVAPVCTPPSGSTFGLGSTIVNCTATDAAGNTASDSFTVNVALDFPPRLMLPAAITVDATSAAGAVVRYTARAVDVIEGPRPLRCLPVSGSTFPVGVTTVDCSATDGTGNTTTGSFTVTVENGRQRPFVDHVVPGRIEAEMFDLGGEGVGYSDRESTNRGDSRLREGDGVDLFDRAELGASDSIIGSTRGGEWTEYTVTLPAPGTYELVGRVASGHSDPGYMRARVNGVAVGTIEGDTGGWYHWQERSFGTARFNRGVNIVRMAWNGGGQVNFDWLELRDT